MTEPIYIVFFLAFGFGMGCLFAKAHTMNDYNSMYSHLTCEIVSRMTRAMRSLRMEQDDIDRVIERMGCKIMPTSVLTPPPTPPEKPAKPKRDFSKEPYTYDEVVLRLSPEMYRGKGEWYCTDRQPYKAWRIEKCDEYGAIITKVFHDMKTHELHMLPGGNETIDSLAKKIIAYNFRFLDDFDRDEWKLYENS